MDISLTHEFLHCLVQRTAFHICVAKIVQSPSNTTLLPGAFKQGKRSQFGLSCCG